MATVYERDLMPALSREMGDTDASNYYYSTDQLFSAINDGVQELNRRSYKQEFSVVSSGDTAYFSPDPSQLEQRLIVLCSALVLTEGEIQKAARNAVIHSNVAGKTDLTGPPEWLLAIRDRLDRQITQAIDDANRETNSDTDGSTLVEGHELKSSKDSSIEGLPITTINTEI